MRLPALALAALCLTAGGALAGCGSAATTIPPVETSPTTLPTPSPAPAGYQSVVLQTTEQTSTDPGGLQVDTVTVTGVTGVPDQTGTAIASFLNSAATAQLAAVRAQPAATDPSAPDTFTATAVVLEADDSYVTVDLDSSAYLGGAHDSSHPEVMTFDRATGAPVTLATITTAGQDAALRTLLATGAEKLLPHAIMPGEKPARSDVVTALKTAPVFPRTDGLEIMFGEYQVASYADGRPFVVVPWSALKGMITPAAIPTSPAPAPVIRTGSLTAVTPAELAAVTGFPSGRIADVADVQDGDSASFLVAQVVPDAAPAADRTVVIRETIDDNGTEHRTIVADVPSRQSCTLLPRAVITNGDVDCP